jgi:hypothetical protein
MPWVWPRGKDGPATRATPATGAAMGAVQPSRWVFTCSSLMIMKLIRLVFLAGTTKAKKIGGSPFMRVWLPRDSACAVVAYVYKIWTPTEFEKALRTAGVDLTSGPHFGDAPCAGPLQAKSKSGLTWCPAGAWVEMPIGIIGVPPGRRYPCEEGQYLEVGTPCAKACFKPEALLPMMQALAAAADRAPAVNSLLAQVKAAVEDQQQKYLRTKGLKRVHDGAPDRGKAKKNNTVFSPRPSTPSACAARAT